MALLSYCQTSGNSWSLNLNWSFSAAETSQEYWIFPSWLKKRVWRSRNTSSRAEGLRWYVKSLRVRRMVLKRKKIQRHRRGLYKGGRTAQSFVLGKTAGVAGRSEVRGDTRKIPWWEKKLQPWSIAPFDCVIEAKRSLQHKPPLEQDLTHPYGKYLAEET